MREKVERRIQDFENKRDSALSSMDIIAAGHYSRQISELKEVLAQHDSIPNTSKANGCGPDDTTQQMER